MSDSVASSCPINSRYEHVDRENKSNFYDLYFMMGKMVPLKSVHIMLTIDLFCCVRTSAENKTERDKLGVDKIFQL